MPSEAEISLNREVASHTSAFTRSTGKDDVVGVRSGDACFAIRAWTPDGEAVTGTLQADDGGLKLGALRFTVSTSPAASGETSRIAYLAVAEHCSGKANSAVERLTAVHLQSQTAGMAWSLSAVIAGSKLELVYDLTALKSSSRKVDGVDVTTTPLQITPTENDCHPSCSAPGSGHPVAIPLTVVRKDDGYGNKCPRVESEKK